VLKLILSRLAQSLLSLIAVTALTFVLLAGAGGDAVSSFGDEGRLSDASRQQMRQVYGLDRPLVERYWGWVSRAAVGDLGRSFFYNAPVASLVLPRLVRTAALGMVALFIAWMISLILGVLAAMRPQGILDRLCELLITLAASTPRIVIALVLLALASGSALLRLGSSSTEAIGLGSLVEILLPALALATPLVALFLAQVREAVGSALAQDFVRAARSRGLSETSVVLKHALRPALNPLLTIFGYSLGSVMSGSVIVETVLNWPGIGWLSVIAVRSRDVPLLMGIVLASAAAVFAANLIADLLLCLNDPRLREEGGAL
jgi:peptide/nickel transport system permease protein